MSLSNHFLIPIKKQFLLVQKKQNSNNFFKKKNSKGKTIFKKEKYFDNIFFIYGARFEKQCVSSQFFHCLWKLLCHDFLRWNLLWPFRITTKMYVCIFPGVNSLFFEVAIPEKKNSTMWYFNFTAFLHVWITNKYSESFLNDNLISIWFDFHLH